MITSPPEPRDVTVWPSRFTGDCPEAVQNGARVLGMGRTDSSPGSPGLAGGEVLGGWLEVGRRDDYREASVGAEVLSRWYGSAR
jgi:hypothetical protein